MLLEHHKCSSFKAFGTPFAARAMSQLSDAETIPGEVRCGFGFERVIWCHKGRRDKDLGRNCRETAASVQMGAVACYLGTLRTYVFLTALHWPSVLGYLRPTPPCSVNMVL